jgi:hypothetical protein
MLMTNDLERGNSWKKTANDFFSVFTRKWIISLKILQCVHKTWNKFSIIEYRRLFIYVHIYLFIHSFIK